MDASAPASTAAGPRILVVTGFWPTRSNPILGVFVVQQVAAYLAAGCAVTVIVPQMLRGRGRGRPYRVPSAGTAVYSPLCPDIPQGLSGGQGAVTFNAWAQGRAILGTLAREGIAPQFDGIHIQDLRYAGVGYPDWGRAVAGPAVVTLHGVDPFIEARAGRPWFARRMARTWRAVHTVALVGAPLQPYADRLGVPRDKARIVHNGSALPEHWQAEQRPSAATRVLLSVSNLVRLKGIDLNLAALARLARAQPGLPWEYRIVGDGPERAALAAQAEALGIGRRVHFLGRLDHQSTLAAIADCDVFSLPSWGENFGIVYLEAMGRGRPVIGCRGWGAAEMVRHGVDGLLVAPGEVDDLTVAIGRLLADPEMCTRLGCAGRARAAEFTWQRNVEQYLSIFARARGDSNAGQS